MVGVVLEVVGFAYLTNCFVNNANINYLIGGLGLLVVGLMFLAKSVPVFIPIKQKKSNSSICPNCGAILREDSAVCEKCEQPIAEENH
jgi:ribosomal protein L40E